MRFINILLVLLLVLSFSSMTFAQAQEDSLGMTPAEFISNYNVTVSTLLGDDAASPILIREAKYSVSSEFDLMSTKIESCNILFHINKSGNLGFIHISGSKNSKDVVDGVSSIVGLFMLAVNKGYGLEDIKPFVDKIKTAIMSKDETNEIKYRGRIYKITTSGVAIQCVIL